MTTKAKTLPPLLREETYPYPDAVYEFYTEDVRADTLHKGDVVSVGGIDRTVARAKIGTKWVEVFDANEDRICRVMRDSKLSVTRHRRTDENREDDQRASSNREILRHLRPHLEHSKDEDFYWASMIGEKLQKALDKTKKGYFLQNYDINAILEAQAETRVLANWVQAARWRAEQHEKGEWQGDLVDVLEEYIAALKDELANTYTQRSLSRSTSMTENLMVDCDNEARAQFIYNAKWWRF